MAPCTVVECGTVLIILGDAVTGVGKAMVTGICKADVKHLGDTVGCVDEIRTDDARCPVFTVDIATVFPKFEVQSLFDKTGMILEEVSFPLTKIGGRVPDEAEVEVTEREPRDTFAPATENMFADLAVETADSLTGVILRFTKFELIGIELLLEDNGKTWSLPLLSSFGVTLCNILIAGIAGTLLEVFTIA